MVYTHNNVVLSWFECLFMSLSTAITHNMSSDLNSRKGCLLPNPTGYDHERVPATRTPYYLLHKVNIVVLQYSKTQYHYIMFSVSDNSVVWYKPFTFLLKCKLYTIINRSISKKNIYIYISQPRAGIWTSNLPVTSQPALAAELQPPADGHNPPFKLFWKVLRVYYYNSPVVVNTLYYI